MFKSNKTHLWHVSLRGQKFVTLAGQITDKFCHRIRSMGTGKEQRREGSDHYCFFLQNGEPRDVAYSGEDVK